MARPSIQIVAYCCEHCAYAAADLAGGLRLQYPPEVKIVQLPCTGKLDVLMVLFVSLAVAVVATIHPSRAAARLVPVEAIRHE